VRSCQGPCASSPTSSAFIHDVNGPLLCTLGKEALPKHDNFFSKYETWATLS